MALTSLVNDRVCFQFKASFSPCTILQLIHYDLDALSEQLSIEIARAPNFFMGSPVLLDIEKLQTAGLLDFFSLKNRLISVGLVPIGIRGGSPEQMTAAASAGLPLVAIGKSVNNEKTQKKPTIEANSAKIVMQPVRSGMQVYAKESDLVVIASVSAGAEILADGHVHVYGPLRGRALAGVQGRMDARIFCNTLEAELVSIAGFYLTKEDIPPISAQHGMIQIYLESGQIRMEAI